MEAGVSKHTPGPWQVGARKKHRVCIDSPAGNWWDFARVVVSVSGHYNAEGEANAQLIAAAPDLLEALSKTRAQWINSVNADECLAALAKAGYPQPPKPEAA